MSLNEVLNKLEAQEEGTAFTIAIPTVKVGDYEKNRIRWKNAIGNLKDQCEKLEISCDEVVKQMETKTKDGDFWANQQNGLVFYHNGEHQEFIKLSHEVIPLVDVGSTFNTYPLISEMQANSTAYVLCLSINRTKLYLISGGEINEVDISENVVKDYEEAMNFDDSSKSLQHHSVGGGDAYFHGNGTEDEKSKIRIEQYLNRVDDGLMEVIQGSNIPLILVCVEEYYPIYEKVTNYNHLHKDMITGNPDNLNSNEVFEKSNCILNDALGKEVDKFLNEYSAKASSDLLFESIDDLRSAIVMQNVDKLLVNEVQIANMDMEERTRITRDLVEASRLGAKMICINDSDSDHVILGVRRFKMETSVN